MSDKLGEENQVGGKVYVLHFQASYRTLASTEIFQRLTLGAFIFLDIQLPGMLSC